MVTRVLPWVITVVLLVGAWFVAQATPTGDEAQARAFMVGASVGEPAEGRNIAVTVQDARIAHAIASEDGFRAEGTWVVIDLDAEAVRRQYGTSLAAKLRIGDATYKSTERGKTSWLIDRTQLVTGIPKSGSLAFQIPADLLTETAVLELTDSSFSAYDSIISLELDLPELTVVNEKAIAPVDWTP
ncbi:hypothetical protein ACFVAE_13870 [Microbacterium sp. NPDC057659]|uniref:hypothetical protein n=1 Tax=Microbacterium sp. NPDC057659 TaxID=3346198 RepID=UPI00366EE455